MFEFTSSTFFWSSVNFVILLFLVHRFALPAFFKMVDENEEKRNKLLTDLNAQLESVSEKTAAYDAKLAALQEESQRILGEAKKEAESLKTKSAEEAHAEKLRLLTGMQNELDAERRKIVSDIRDRAVDLVTGATSKIVGKTFSVAEHEAVIRESLSDFEKQVSR